MKLKPCFVLSVPFPEGGKLPPDKLKTPGPRDIIGMVNLSEQLLKVAENMEPHTVVRISGEHSELIYRVADSMGISLKTITDGIKNPATFRT